MRISFVGLLLTLRCTNGWASWNASEEEYNNLTHAEQRKFDRYITWCNASDLGDFLILFGIISEKIIVFLQEFGCTGFREKALTYFCDIFYCFIDFRHVKSNQIYRDIF